MSEQILLLNPRHKARTPKRRTRRHRRSKRGGRMPAGLRRYWATHRRANPRRHKRRAKGSYAHSRRHNRRHASRRHASRRHIRRHYAHARRHNRHHTRRYNRRSARQVAGSVLGRGRNMLSGSIMPMAIGGAGGVVMDIAWGYLSPRLPQQLQGGWGSLAAKLGVVLLGRYAMNRYLPKYRAQTDRATFGAGAILAYGALRGLAKQAIPSLPLSGYVDYQSYSLPGLRGYMPMGGYIQPQVRTLGSLEDMYSPAAVIQPPGTPVPRPFGSYVAVQPHVSGNGGLMGYDWAHDGM